MPATIPSEAHSPASVRSAHSAVEPGACSPRVGRVGRRSPGEDEPGRADSEQQEESDHTGVGEHLDVEVLDAPLATFRREREVDDIGKALARVGDVRLEDLRPRGALPADADDRVVLPDPQPDVGEHGPLRVRLDADGRLVAANADEAQEVLERVAANGGHAAGDYDHDRGQGENSAPRRREAAARREPECHGAEREPACSCDRARDDETEHAAGERDGEERACRDVAFCPASDPCGTRAPRRSRPARRGRGGRGTTGCRHPAFQAPKMSSPKNWSSATPTATAAHRTSPPRTIVRSCCAANEERHRNREQRVLAELEEAHEVVVEQRVVESRPAERREREPREQRDAGNPEEPGRPQPGEAEPHGGDRPRRCDGE